MTHTPVSVSAGCNLAAQSPLDHGVEAAVSGGPSALSFSASETGSGTGQNATVQHSFTGSLSGDVITGSFTFETHGQSSAGGNAFTSSGSITIPVTLQR